MWRLSFIALFAAFVSHSAFAADAAAALEVMGRLPNLEDVALSPDGTKIAFVRTVGDRRDILAAPLAHIDKLVGAHVGDTKLRGITWLNNDIILITVSDTKPIGFFGPTGEAFRLYTFETGTLKLIPVSFSVPGIRTSGPAGGITVREMDGKAKLFVPGTYGEGYRAVLALFSFSLPELHARIVDQATLPQGQLRYNQWLIDEAGQIPAQFSYYDKDQLWEIRTQKDNRWTRAASGTAAIDPPEMLGFNADGSAIIVRFVENGSSVWKSLDLRTNAWSAPLDKSDMFSEVVEDRKTGRIVGGAPVTGDNRYVFFDNELQAHWNAVLRAFPDEQVRLVSHSDDYSKIILRVFGAKEGFVYALFDWYGHHTTILGPVYEGLAAPAEVRAIHYPAADGLSIPGFLTLPRAAEKNLPLIVLPHGGPAAADTLDFDWWAQAYAAQGYAVLQPNFRGSTVSASFLEAGFGEWGRKMQTDLSDGVRYLARQGVIDPKRVCIVGASYGGYAALAGITLDTGVYRCAVSVAGISDLRRFRTWTAAENASMTQRRRVQRYWDRFMGTSDQEDPALVAISPIDHVNAVNVPVLLIHGRDDTVVPYEQSDVMLSALKRAGKSVELVTLKHEDHWLSHSETRLQMLEASVAFLKANNAPN